jgi:hypothetical protein
LSALARSPNAPTWTENRPDGTDATTAGFFAGAGRGGGLLLGRLHGRAFSTGFAAAARAARGVASASAARLRLGPLRGSASR